MKIHHISTVRKDFSIFSSHFDIKSMLKIYAIFLILINIVFYSDVTKAGQIWSSSDELSGASGCGVAMAQATLIYGSRLCRHGCTSSNEGNVIIDVNTSNAEVCFPGDPMRSAGGFRNGTAILGCTDGQVRSSGECLDPDQVSRASTGEGYCPVGNPIDPLTGIKTEYVVDFTTSGSRPLALERYYTSNVMQYSARLAGSELGYGWGTNFDARGMPGSNSNRPSIYIFLPSGKRFVFIENNDNSWSRAYLNSNNNDWVVDSNPSVETLKLAAKNYELTDAENLTWVLNQSGQLIQKRYSDSYTQDITYTMNAYGTAPVNKTVIDSFNRQIAFNYNALGLLVSANTSAGTIKYSYLDRIDPLFTQKYLSNAVYDPTQKMLQPVLQTVTHPGNFSPAFTYLYEDDINRIGLTGVVDGRGVRYATFKYNSLGYAIGTNHAGNNSYSLSYDNLNGITTVTNPLGKINKFKFEISKNRRLFVGIEGQASASCPASLTQIVHDNSGFISSSTDEEGRNTTYTRDSRGRATVITRGAP